MTHDKLIFSRACLFCVSDFLLLFQDQITTRIHTLTLVSVLVRKRVLLLWVLFIMTQLKWQCKDCIFYLLFGEIWYRNSVKYFYSCGISILVIEHIILHGDTDHEYENGRMMWWWSWDHFTQKGHLSSRVFWDKSHVSFYEIEKISLCPYWISQSMTGCFVGVGMV